jgi:hypothetical protein
MWNVRGMNSIEKRREIRELISYTGADLVCLVETKLKEEQLYKILPDNFFNALLLSNHRYHSRGRVLVTWNPKT